VELANFALQLIVPSLMKINYGVQMTKHIKILFLTMPLLAFTIFDANAQKGATASTVEEAKKAASADGKLIFIKYGRPNCGNCRNLQGMIDNGSVDVSKFIFLDLNCDTPAGQTEMRPYRDKDARSLPFVALLDPKGDKIGFRSGFGDSSSYNTFISEAKKKNIFGDRDWTAYNGKALPGRFAGLKDGKAMFTTSSGSKKALDLRALSQKDIELVYDSNDTPAEDRFYALREWTSAGGGKINAQLVAAKDGQVKLRLATGSEKSLPLDKFSVDDQNFVGRAFP